MRYMVTGRVHPERADIHFSRIELPVEDNGRVVAQCDSSQITILLELDSIDGWITAYVQAEHFAEMIVGASGFALGSGYSVELVQVTEEDGTPHVFGVRPRGEDNSTLGFEPHDPVFRRAFSLANRDIFFRLALRDYLRGINEIDDASYCYRAIEAIKSSFAFKTGKDGWDIMHKALGTDRTSIDRKVKDYADPVRHGNWANAEPTDRFIRWQMLLLTRDILLKYLDHEMPATEERHAPDTA